jgi:2-polyprenyl-3-methyl-5-hydroxy-6-metoxy-1,4-benzoquinol methylase
MLIDHVTSTDSPPVDITEVAMSSKAAVESWNRRWATDAGRADYLEPHPEVVALLPELRSRGARTALDLGCGVGHHSLFLAEAGLDVVAMDSSATGLEVLRETAAARNLTLELRQGDADTRGFVVKTDCVGSIRRTTNHFAE